MVLSAELLPQLDAAIAHVRGELAQLHVGALDEHLLALAEAPPLPSAQFAALLRAWEPPPLPPALVSLARSLTPSDGSSESVEVHSRSTSAGPPDTAAGLLALRKTMLLDVLSKIRSVAKSKGVDPAMFATRKAATEGGGEEFMDLEAIAREVERGAIAEWELFAHQVFLFCQHVIADSEKLAQPAAKQKGVELLHFARTLTETLRKASAKKEEALLKEIGSQQQEPQEEEKEAAPAATVASEAGVTAPEQIESAEEAEKQEEDEKQRREDAEEPEMASADTSGLPPSPSLAPNTSPPVKRLSVDYSLTPNRVSARIRQRGSSFSFGDTAAHMPRNDDDGGGDSAETRVKKRPRAVSSASSSTATPPPPSTAIHTTASEDENPSECESQLSVSEAESHKRRGSSSKAKEAASNAQTTPVTRQRTRQRRPVLPATRASSRQQKRRAASRARAAEHDDEEKEEASDAAGNVNEGGDEDTAQDDDEDENNSDAAAAAAADAADATPPPPSVPLTKAGRPRKRPGRKPAGWKKGDAK